MELGTAMAFPFWWIGALTAGLFLAASFLLFGLALRLLNRATTEIRGSVLPGLVSGFRDWTETMPAGLLQAQSLPKISLQIDKGTDSKGLSTTLQIVLLLTVLALAPSILVMTTSFIRIIIVLSFVRQALGTNQLPPSQLIMGVALVMTMFVMSPIISQVHDKAWQAVYERRDHPETAL